MQSNHNIEKEKMYRSSGLYILTFLMLFLCSFSVNGQDSPPVQPYKYDMRVNGLIPHPMSNNGFTGTFIGLFTFSGSINTQLFDNFYAGVYYANSMFNVPTDKLVASNGYRISTALQMNCMGLNLGHDYYFSSNGLLSTSISLGEDYSKYNGIETITPVKITDNYTAAFANATCSIIWLLEEHMGIGFQVDYTYVAHEFNPYDVALNQFKGYSGNDLKGNTSYLEFGFNVYLGIVKKKKK